MYIPRPSDIEKFFVIVIENDLVKRNWSQNRSKFIEESD